MSLWANFTRSGLDPAATNPVLLRRIRAVNLAIFGLIVVALPFVYQYWRIGLPEISMAVIASAVSAVCLLGLLRRTHDPNLVGGLGLLVLFVLLLLSNIASGGFYDPNFAWFYVVPIAAVTFTTRRQAVFWSVVVLLTTIAFWVLDETGYAPESAVPVDEHALQSLFNRASAVVGIALMIALFVQWQVHAELSLRDANEKLRMQEREMRRLALFDALTGLPSRACLDRKLEALDKEEESFALIFADLDRFKTINDTLGHPAGDQLLIEVGQRFESVVGTPSRTSLPELDELWAAPHPLVARRGGDEVVVVLPGASADEAREVAERMIETLARPVELEERQIVVSVSMGVAAAPRHGTNAASLMRAADVALYEAKRQAGSTVVVYQTQMTQSTPRALLLEEALRQAIKADELRVVFQPLFDAHREVCAAEALLRWQSVAFSGEVSPAELIPVAETTGLIVPIGKMVLRQACMEAVGWSKPFRVAVNVSPVQLRNPNFVDHVKSALSASGLHPGRLELEITESVLLDDDRPVQRCLDALRALGVRMTVDDFGMGYSNLSQLRRLPVSRVKIDRAFVSRMHDDPADAALVRAIVAMGHSLRLEVVAEGVENDEQVVMLQEMRCDEMQGFHLGTPVEADEFLRFVTTLATPPRVSERA
ncbi:MAG: EAL domain-containing protein [Myxococcota bacterium]